MRGRLWRAVEAAEAVLMDSAERGNIDGVLRAVHALTQASGAYARLIETGELEARLAALEASLEAAAETPATGAASRTAEASGARGGTARGFTSSPASA
ncbi:hypothetical protein [Rubricoccus marinus]|uniref:Uncharacterized protein n=1 Tax=Rubricoccus marinus TaxID=716817 RepID=A0A259U1Z9_9BACT|nr:hypothetical protein [Rubricoccus marinus]OZC04029.1 hypothetical protein BSZ36_14175 [Rubricoccus marinus]